MATEEEHEVIAPPLKKKPAKRKKAKRKSRAKASPASKKKLSKKEELTPGDRLEYRKGKLSAADMKEHLAYKEAGRIPVTCYLRPGDYEWVVNYAEMTGGNVQTMIEYLVRNGKLQDPTKGGTVGFIQRQGNKVLIGSGERNEHGGGGTHIEGSNLPPITKF